MPELANYRRERFSRFYLVYNGNQTQAALGAGFARSSARQYGSYLMASHDIKARIEELKSEAFDLEGITPEFIRRAFLKEALEADASRDRKAALDSLARCNGMFTDNVNQGAPENMAEVLKALQEVLPRDQLAKLAKQFKVDLPQGTDRLPEPTAPGTETQQ